MTVTFACGHKASLPSDVKDTPVCPTCQESRITRVDAPKPRFTMRTA